MLIRDYQSMQSLGLLWLVFDTGLSATSLIGHLGYLASHWSVQVAETVTARVTDVQSFFLHFLLWHGLRLMF
mgnify:CR=1 FL=1